MSYERNETILPRILIWILCFEYFFTFLLGVFLILWATLNNGMIMLTQFRISLLIVGLLLISASILAPINKFHGFDFSPLTGLRK